MAGVPVTLDRILRALVGQMLGEGMTHGRIADLFGADRTQITKYINATTRETRALTLDYLRRYAETLPGGAKQLVARLNSITLELDPDVLSEDEKRTTSGKRGRPRREPFTPHHEHGKSEEHVVGSLARHALAEKLRGEGAQASPASKPKQADTHKQRK